MRLRYLTTLCCFLPLALSLDYFVNVDDLVKEPTLLTGDISEFRIPIDGETFANWGRVVDYNGLIEAFLEFYQGAAKEWERLFYGRPSQEAYNRLAGYTEQVDRVMENIFEVYRKVSKGKDPPVRFQNTVIEWANILFEVVMSTKDNPFYNVPALAKDEVPAEYAYTVDMLNRDFPENYEDALRFEDEPLSRTTADHIHLLLTPRFRGPRDPSNRYGRHIKSKYEQVERYLLNAVEGSARKGEGVQADEFQFVVSDLDVSLEHKLVTVYVDPNKTTRMRNTLLKLRDRLLEVRKQGLIQAWDIRLAMGKYDSRVAGWNRTMEEQERAAEEKARVTEDKKKNRGRLANFWYSFGDPEPEEVRRTKLFPRKQKAPIFQQWQVLKDLVRQITLLPGHLIDDLTVLAEILRVMEVPQLPESENSVQLAKNLTFDPIEAPKYMRLSNIETMASPVNRNTSPANQNTSPGGLLLKLEEADADIREPTYREGTDRLELEPTDRTDRAFEDLLDVIPISLDLRDRESDGDSGSQQAVQLVREGPDPIGADRLKLLSTDVSPSARSLLHPGSSPGGRNYSPPRRSIFSGTNSRFSDAIDNAEKNQ
ncbi:hypothetical protein TWF506_006064 [Arthrobotrys conoides]|uniref:Uncharacterized protein n=1 Tax=Arthrobotrys conoides TaxID=74498 RepID=A0AAN8RTU2_9PEZI